MRVASTRPASVGITERVVRVSKGAPMLVSNRVMVSLTVEADSPKRRAAVRKPPASVTARKIVKSSSEGALFDIPNTLFGFGRIINFCRTAMLAPAKGATA